MIDVVSFSGTTFAELPGRLEAGTPNISGAIGFGEAVRFLSTLDFSDVHQHEARLLEQCTRGLNKIGGVSVVGTAGNKASVVSFNIDGVHPYDTGSILDRLGVAVRTGHHCTMPLMERLGLPGTVRASMALYNTSDDVDQLLEAVAKAKQLLT
jgi:cysteine desulfurase/selenocysteine lyase